MREHLKETGWLNMRDPGRSSRAPANAVLSRLLRFTRFEGVFWDKFFSSWDALGFFGILSGSFVW